MNFLIWHRVKIFFCKWHYRPFPSVDCVNPVMFLSEVPQCPFSSLTLLRSLQTLTLLWYWVLWQTGSEVECRCVFVGVSDRGSSTNQWIYSACSRSRWWCKETQGLYWFRQSRPYVQSERSILYSLHRGARSRGYKLKERWNWSQVSAGCRVDRLRRCSQAAGMWMCVCYKVFFLFLPSKTAQVLSFYSMKGGLGRYMS